MTEDQAKAWMTDLAAGPIAPLPDFDRVWALRLLEEEFEQRRRATVPFAWVNVAFQSAAGFAAAALLVWWG